VQSSLFSKWYIVIYLNCPVLEIMTLASGGTSIFPFFKTKLAQAYKVKYRLLNYHKNYEYHFTINEVAKRYNCPAAPCLTADDSRGSKCQRHGGELKEIKVAMLFCLTG
jgi:hypothetical protein